MLSRVLFATLSSCLDRETGEIMSEQQPEKPSRYAGEIRDLALNLESDLIQMSMYRYTPTTIRARKRIDRLVWILAETKQNISNVPLLEQEVPPQK